MAGYARIEYFDTSESFIFYFFDENDFRELDKWEISAEKVILAFEAAKKLSTIPVRRA